jgi:hypothetical protein
MWRSTLACLSALLLATACGGGAPNAADESQAQRACAGLPDAVVDQGIANLRANVDGAAPLHEVRAKAPPKLVGASVQVLATPGMTPQWIGRIVQCDAERHTSAALVPPGARVEVSPTATGFIIAARSSDHDLALEIERRVSLLAHVAQ